MKKLAQRLNYRGFRSHFRRIALLLLPMFGFLSSDASPLEIGASAPTITVTSSEGDSIDLAELYAKGPTLVYFYPKADTPGCTTQACNLRDSYETLTDSGIQVVGVSTDEVEAQAAFKEKYSLPTSGRFERGAGRRVWSSEEDELLRFPAVFSHRRWRCSLARPESDAENSVRRRPRGVERRSVIVALRSGAG